MKYFLISWLLLLSISVLYSQENLSTVLVILAPDYPTNFLQFGQWGDYELRPDLKKVYFAGHAEEVFFDASQKLSLWVNYYISEAMEEQKLRNIYVFPGDQIKIEIRKNQAGTFEINFQGNNAEGHVQMDFAGSWSDLSEEEFENFMQANGAN